MAYHYVCCRNCHLAKNIHNLSLMQNLDKGRIRKSTFDVLRGSIFFFSPSPISLRAITRNWCYQLGIRSPAPIVYLFQLQHPIPIGHIFRFISLLCCYDHIVFLLGPAIPVAFFSSPLSEQSGFQAIDLALGHNSSRVNNENGSSSSSLFYQLMGKDRASEQFTF